MHEVDHLLHEHERAWSQPPHKPPRRPRQVPRALTRRHHAAAAMAGEAGGEDGGAGERPAAAARDAREQPLCDEAVNRNTAR